MPHAVICVDAERVDRDDHGVHAPAVLGVLLHVRHSHIALALSPASSRGQITQKMSKARAINIATEKNDIPQRSCDMPPESSRI